MSENGKDVSKKLELEISQLEQDSQERQHVEMDEKVKRAEEWSNQGMEVKKKEFLKMEQQSLPVRQYLMKNIFPKIANGIVEVTKVRPENPIQFLGNYLRYENTEIDIEIDQEMLNEFENLLKCQK